MTASEIGVTVQVACTLGIAAFVALVGWLQYQTARSKLKLDLFDRRYKVYLGIRDLFATVAREATFSRDALNPYWAATDEGRFLFSSDIRDYITEVRLRYSDLIKTQREMESFRDKDEKKFTAACEKENELMQWFDKESERLADRFLKYLGFQQNL